MGTAIITGIFALIGVLIGAQIQRKTQLQTWRLERRLEAFTDLLTSLDDCIDKAESLPDCKEEDTSIFQEFNQIYAPAFRQAKIVRLLLMSDSKERIEELVRGIWSLHISRKTHERRNGSIAEHLTELQNILERNLLCSEWDLSNGKIAMLWNKVLSRVRELISRSR